MKQPIKSDGKLKKKKPRATHKKSPFKRRNFSNQKYGTSQLERDFARDFLDAYDIAYIYQYEAKDIGRFYDFAISCLNKKDFIMEEKDGLKCIRQENQYVPIDILIEIDGSYHHADPRIVKDKALNPMQKHNKFVDSLKDKWAGLHCIPLLRIWEYDIRHNPKKVIEELKKYVSLGEKREKILEDRKRPH